MSESDTTVVSHEQDGRILSGVGVDVADLQTTMDRHTPESPSETPVAPVTTEPASDAKPTRGQKRFADLTREREDAKRERDAAIAERDTFKQQLEQARTAAPVRAEPAVPRAPAKATPAATRPKPSEEQIGVQYQTYADFVEDLADWKAEQRLAALDFDARIRTSLEADRASRTRADLVTTAIARGKAAFPDFEAVLQAPHMTANNWPPDKIEAIAALDAPEHIQYVLGKDPALAERLRTLDPVRFGLELATLMPVSPVASPASTGRTVVTPPPPPYQPVVGGSKTTVTPSADLAKGYDFDKSGYREQRARERGVSRR